MTVGESCVVQSPQYAAWTFGDNGKIGELRWHFDLPWWEQQLESCSVPTGVLTKGRPNGTEPLPQDPAVTARLHAVYAQLIAASQYPTQDPRWLQSRMSVFAPGDAHGNGVVACDPYPVCATNRSAIAAALTTHGSQIARTAQSLLTPIWVSGNVGAAMTTFTGKMSSSRHDAIWVSSYCFILSSLTVSQAHSFSFERLIHCAAAVLPASAGPLAGCMASHVHMETFVLADGGGSSAGVIET